MRVQDADTPATLGHVSRIGKLRRRLIWQRATDEGYPIQAVTRALTFPLFSPWCLQDS